MITRERQNKVGTLICKLALGAAIVRPGALQEGSPSVYTLYAIQP